MYAYYFKGNFYRRCIAAFSALLIASGLFLFAAIPVFAEENIQTTQYVVQRGDNLYKISANLLGDGKRWREIYNLNKATIKNPSIIRDGQTIIVPQTAVAQPTEDQLSAESTQLAQAMYAKSAAAEPQVTAMLHSMESDKAHLAGLESRLKTIESLSRKIKTDAKDMEVSPAEAAGQIKDSLRYTFVIDDADYNAVTTNTLNTLLSQGYKLISFKNFWAKDDNSYQGINTVLSTPDGVLFELQFHTPKSFNVKTYEIHELYEIVRSDTATPEEKAAATAKSDEISKTIPVPEGVRDINFPVTK